MRFFTRFIDAAVSRIAGAQIAAAVQKAVREVADAVSYEDLSEHLNLDKLAAAAAGATDANAIAECIQVGDLAKYYRVADIAAAIDEDHLVDLLTDTVMENIDQDKMQRDIESNIAGDIDAESVARELDLSEVASNLDYSDLAREVDFSNLVGELDLSDLAGHLCCQEVADNLDLDKLANKIDYRQLAHALIEVAAAAKAKAQPAA